ncbi:MAG TPA: RluA family pseudouridine synthase [Candidatus Saccharimonadales bacterium]|nr:RluA family pseudouridine synthase [Candidatus Saccharimonadales bacterium]
MKKTILISESGAGQRTDVFVAALLHKYSRSSLKALFDAGSVKINGKSTKPGYKLRAGEKLSMDTAKISKRPDPVELPIIYQDDDVIVINKPAGVLTHSKGALNLEPTVASFIAAKLKDKTLSGNRAGIVHRLDRPTSGVIICARNTSALKWLQREFAGRKAKKFYNAIVEGEIKPQAAIIDAPIGRNPNKPQTFKAMAGGKPAQTEYKVKEIYRKDNRVYSLIELKPRTGRTHQIRVHLAYIGHPVAGDGVYGKGGADTPLLLHARKLELTLPNGKRKSFLAPLPGTFKEFKEL